MDGSRGGVPKELLVLNALLRFPPSIFPPPLARPLGITRAEMTSRFAPRSLFAPNGKIDDNDGRHFPNSVVREPTAKPTQRGTEADGRERLPGRVQQVGMGMMKAIAIVIVRRRL